MSLRAKTTNSEFCKSFKWARSFRWFGRMGVAALDEDRVVKLTLVTHGTHRLYAGFRVEITHKQRGVLDTSFHAFKDHNLPSVNEETFGWQFRPAEGQTKNTAAFCEAVETYLNYFE